MLKVGFFSFLTFIDEFSLGTLEDNQNVLIDYGTGFFVERDLGKANSFCDRKILLLKENLEKVANIIKTKRKLLDQITLELQKKIQMQLQQQQISGNK